MQQLKWFTGFFLLFFINLSLALTVPQTYQTLGVNQVTFNAAKSRLPKAEALYLQEMFSLTDKLAQTRVTFGMKLANAKQNAEKLFEAYQRTTKELQNKLHKLTTPKNLQPVLSKINTALNEQVAYYAQKLEKDKQYHQIDFDNKLVQHSHQQLLAAYYKLMTTFPSANRHSQQAFYAHLCVLDLI